MSVSTVSGEKLDALASGGNDVRFLSGRVPSLNIESSFGRAFPRFYIRGYGNTDFRLNTSQPVSLVYDDVVQENPILKGFPVFDVGAGRSAARPAGFAVRPQQPGRRGQVRVGAPVAGLQRLRQGRPRQRQHVEPRRRRRRRPERRTGRRAPRRCSSAATTGWRTPTRARTTASRATTSPPGACSSSTKAKSFEALLNGHARHLNGTARLFRANIIQPGTNDLVAGFDANGCRSTA